MRFRVLLALALCVSLKSQVFAEDVALTFDDLPSLSSTDSLDYWRVTTERLLSTLERRKLPATGFVNEDKLEGDDHAQRLALLTAWLDAGMDLGDHGYAHLSLTKTAVDAYIADAAHGEVETRALLAARGRSPRWFRYPFLQTGPTLATRQTFEAWLSAHSYRVAPVTLGNADWMFAIPYDDAVLRGDHAAEKHIRKSYVAYTAKVVRWTRGAALQLLDRRPALIFLLHASRLNADSLDQIADILKRNHLYGVTLDQAMADPAYAIADTYVGPNGDEWLTRWAMTLHRALPWSTFPKEPKAIAEAYQRLEKGS